MKRRKDCFTLSYRLRHDIHGWLWRLASSDKVLSQQDQSYSGQYLSDYRTFFKFKVEFFSEFRPIEEEITRSTMVSDSTCRSFPLLINHDYCSSSGRRRNCIVFGCASLREPGRFHCFTQLLVLDELIHLSVPSMAELRSLELFCWNRRICDVNTCSGDKLLCGCSVILHEPGQLPLANAAKKQIERSIFVN